MLSLVMPHSQIGCEPEKFSREMNEGIEGNPRGERVVIGTDFNRRVVEEKGGNKGVICTLGVQDRNAER